MNLESQVKRPPAHDFEEQRVVRVLAPPGTRETEVRTRRVADASFHQQRCVCVPIDLGSGLVFPPLLCRYR